MCLWPPFACALFPLSSWTHSSGKNGLSPEGSFPRPASGYFLVTGQYVLPHGNCRCYLMTHVPEVLDWIQVCRTRRPTDNHQCPHHLGTADTPQPHNISHRPAPAGTKGPLDQYMINPQWVWGSHLTFKQQSRYISLCMNLLPMRTMYNRAPLSNLQIPVFNLHSAEPWRKPHMLMSGRNLHVWAFEGHFEGPDCAPPEVLAGLLVPPWHSWQFAGYHNTPIVLYAARSGAGIGKMCYELSQSRALKDDDGLWPQQTKPFLTRLPHSMPLHSTSSLSQFHKAGETDSDWLALKEANRLVVKWEYLNIYVCWSMQKLYCAVNNCMY